MFECCSISLSSIMADKKTMRNVEKNVNVISGFKVDQVMLILGLVQLKVWLNMKDYESLSLKDVSLLTGGSETSLLTIRELKALFKLAQNMTAGELKTRLPNMVPKQFMLFSENNTFDDLPPSFVSWLASVADLLRETQE